MSGLEWCLNFKSEAGGADKKKLVFTSSLCKKGAWVSLEEELIRFLKSLELYNDEITNSK